MPRLRSLIVGAAAALSAAALLLPPAPGAAVDRRPRAGPAAVADETDRLAFQRWFTFLADAQFERRTDDVIDCASLVRHAYREALRPHSPEWYRGMRLPMIVSFSDVRQSAAEIRDGAWLLFRISDQPLRFGEFADAATLIRLNARFLGRDPLAAEPGDLFYFRQEDAGRPDHLMVMIGDSPFDPSRRDWVVYHTGPQAGDRGEVRKVSLADLERHPASRWRPVSVNPAFVGIFRLSRLDRTG